MALIYTKGVSDKTTVLAPREGAYRQFDFDDDWTDVRLGCFVTNVGTSGSNTAPVVENLAVSTVDDYLTFVIKNYADNNPGRSGSLFIGVRNGGIVTNQQTPIGGVHGNTGQWLPVGYEGTTEVAGSAIGTSQYFGRADATASSGYCAFNGIRIVISNRGTASQSVAVYWRSDDSKSGNYGITDLTNYINSLTNADWGTPQSFAWNTGSVARDIPDSVWLRSPLYNNQLRLSAITAIRFV